MDEQNTHETPLSVVKPIHDPMSDGEISTLLQFYPEVGGLRRRLRDSGRPYSAGTLMETGNGRFFLKKRSTGFRPRQDVLWRHRLIAHLVTQGFPTPAVVTNRDGGTLTDHNGYYYELFEAAAGEDYYREYHSWMPFDHLSHAHDAGKMLALFHAATRDFPLSGVTPVGRSPGTPMSARFDLAYTPDVVAAMEDRIATSPVLSEYFSAVPWKKELSGPYGEFHREFQRYRSVIEPAVTHGDWHANNMMYDGDSVTSVIDFHLADVSCRAYDIVVALDRNAIQWLDILAGKPEAVRYDVIEELLRGYASVTTVAEQEAKLLAALMPIHQLDLALSNIEYYLVYEGNRERADWVYGVYLRDHARHYLTPAGQRILAFVSQAV